ncbi:MAG TPA: hypothetical protein VFB77_13170 [Acidimicrobiales bacterium]|nr:hypothetical protein [Acidimicrobiales bacterium]
MTDDHEPADGGHVHPPHEVRVLSDLAADPVDQLEHALRCHHCGLTLLGLIISSPAWVTRRVESVSFRDHRTVRRRVSVDFTVPLAAPTFIINGTPYRLLPLTIMRRKSLVNFDLRDESDASVPLLGLRQNQAVTLALVEALACAVLGDGPLSAEVGSFLEHLVSGTQDELLAARNLADNPDAPPEIRQLSDDRRFNHIMNRVSEDFVMFVLVRADGSAKRVFKFRYDEPLSRRYRARESTENGYRRFTPALPRWSIVSLLAAIGWAPTRVRFPTPAAENAASYHFEIHAPAGVTIDSARMLAGRPEQSLARRRPSIDQVTGGLPTVDLHAIEVERGSLSRAQVDLRLAADSWLTLATASAWLTAVALFWAARRLGAPDDRENAAASALFITFTVALAAILWRPPEHRMAVRLLSAVGLMAYTSCLLLLVAAALFVFEPTGDLTGGLITLVVVASIVALLLTVTRAVVVRASRKDWKLSPWEQGRGIAELQGAAHDDDIAAAALTFETASQHLGFGTPAIKVESAEADAAAGLTLDDDLVHELRALVAQGVDRQIG